MNNNTPVTTPRERLGKFLLFCFFIITPVVLISVMTGNEEVFIVLFVLMIILFFIYNTWGDTPTERARAMNTSDPLSETSYKKNQKAQLAIDEANVIAENQAVIARLEKRFNELYNKEIHHDPR